MNIKASEILEILFGYIRIDKSKYPKDLQIWSVDGDWRTDCICISVSSEEFEEIPEGQHYPTIPLYFEHVR